VENSGEMQFETISEYAYWCLMRIDRLETGADGLVRIPLHDDLVDFLEWLPEDYKLISSLDYDSYNSKQSMLFWVLVLISVSSIKYSGEESSLVIKSRYFDHVQDTLNELLRGKQDKNHFKNGMSVLLTLGESEKKFLILAITYFFEDSIDSELIQVFEGTHIHLIKSYVLRNSPKLSFKYDIHKPNLSIKKMVETNSNTDIKLFLSNLIDCFDYYSCVESRKGMIIRKYLVPLAHIAKLVIDITSEFKSVKEVTLIPSELILKINNKDVKISRLPTEYLEYCFDRKSQLEIEQLMFPRLDLESSRERCRKYISDIKRKIESQSDYILEEVFHNKRAKALELIDGISYVVER